MIFCGHCGANLIPEKEGVHYCSMCRKGNEVVINKSQFIIHSVSNNEGNRQKGNYKMRKLMSAIEAFVLALVITILFIILGIWIFV
jgi:DNA-directed RNA polymerase subunit M/transcription elongation factor TFIIS